MSFIEALYIFDEHNNILVEHVYNGRPASADILLPSYIAHPSPRPSFLHLPNITPPTLVSSIVQDNLLFLCPTSTDTEPLVVLEFLHRVADALEEFLGSPLLASKLETSNDVVAQLILEMCDAGIVSNTEPNSLREVVEVPTWMSNFFGGFGLPSSSPSVGTSSLQRAIPGSSNTVTSTSGSAIPWRRSNVRHTSNELYVDIVESLSVVLAPSGRPLSAVAYGSIAFTSQISGVPDLLLNLTAPGGQNGMKNAMSLPCFHPCVRLARWRDKPGELSFVPPDGRFVLAGYECDLLPDIFGPTASTSPSGKIKTPNLNLPASLELNPSLGPNGDELELRFTLSSRTTQGSASSAAAQTNRIRSGPGTFGGSSPSFGNSTNATPGPPPVENIIVTVPLEEDVRNVSDLRSSKGEAQFQPLERVIEWRIPTKEAATIGGAGATMRCTLIGPVQETDHQEKHNDGFIAKADRYDYDENEGASYQNGHGNERNEQVAETHRTDMGRIQQNASLMPRSADLSFSIRGWLASGLKVDSLNINTVASKGLGAGITPYKGVKYHTVSRRGIEIRC